MADLKLAPVELSPTVTDAAIELLPLLLSFETGKYALGLSGSMSKSTSDALSDVDFRFYSENPRPDPGPAWEGEWQSLRQRWAERGVTLDELWFRTVKEVDTSLDEWLAGTAEPDPLIWTIWGYHPLTDLARQIPVVDATGLIAGWRARLDPYPLSVRDSMIRRHLAPLRYWRGDYHYASKAQRGDLLFLAGLTSALSHHLIQVLAALNGVYFPGDGNNLVVAEGFAIAPIDLTTRLGQVLYPARGLADLSDQRERMIALIDDLECLLAQALPGERWT